MTTYNLDLVVRAIDKASAELGNVGRSLQGTEDSARAAARGLHDVGVALAAAGAAGTALIGSSTMVAARNEELAVVLRTVGRNAGYSDRELSNYESAVRAMGITTQASRQALIQMAQAEIDLAQAADIARLAQDAAVIAQIDSSEAFERLVTGIQQANPLMLRHMGVIVDFQQAYEDYAAATGVSSQALSDQEKMQVRVNAVMESGAGIAGTYEAAMDTAGKQLRSINRHWEEARAAIGENYLPMLGAAVTGITNLLKAFNELDPGVQRAISLMLGAGAATASLGGAIIVALPKLIAMQTALTAAGTTLGAILISAAAVVAGLFAIAETAQFVQEVEERHNDVSQAFAERLGEQAEQTQSAVYVTSDYIRGMDKILEIYQAAPWWFRLFNRESRFVDDGMRALIATLNESADSYDEYHTQLNRALEAQPPFADGARYIIDTQGDLIRVIETSTGVHEDLVEANYALGHAEFLTARMTEQANEAIAAGAFRQRAAQMGELYSGGWQAAEAARQAAIAYDAFADSTIALDQRLDLLNLTISGPVTAANEEYLDQRQQILDRMAELNGQYDELGAKHGIVVSSQNALTIATYEAQVAAGELAEAQAALAENTDPEKQLQLEAAVARAAGGVDRANQALGSAGPYVTDYSEQMGEVRGELGELEGALVDLETQHREAMNKIVYDITIAQLAVDGWTEAEAGLAVTLARDMGLIDQSTYEMAVNIQNTLGDFAASEDAAAAENRLKTIRDVALEIPSFVPIEVRTTGIPQAQAAAIELQNRLSQIERNITVNLMTHAEPYIPAGAGNVPGRQHGGPVAAGQPTIVGEAGWELFVPWTSGHIVPHGEAGRTQERTVAPVIIVVQDHDGLHAAGGEWDYTALAELIPQQEMD